MAYVKWTALALVTLVVAAFLHWSLPSRDIVRILGTEVARSDVEVSNQNGQEVSRTRDIRFIKAASADGEPMVYRNEDTDWSWPPYLKFDSANLAAEADNRISTEAEPRWTIVTHYGWRITWLSTFPNAVSLDPAEGPDQSLVPWFNIVVLALLAAAVLFIRRKALALLGLDG